MKMKWLAISVVLAWGVTAEAVVSPEDILDAVDQMTEEQVRELYHKLGARWRKPMSKGTLSRLTVDLGSTFSRLDTVDLSSVTLSGGSMDVEDPRGSSFGLLWRFGRGDRLRVGARFGSWEADDSNRGAEGYSRVNVTGKTMMLALNYQFVRTDPWILWAEVAPGGGWIEVDTLDTPTGEASTLRELERGFPQVDFQVGASWRLNSFFSFYLSGGYRLAEAVNLKEGGESTPVRVNASGFSGRCGFGINF